MALARPNITVYKAENGKEQSGQVIMPQVMLCPLRPDLVRFVHTNMRKNSRQPYAVKMGAGYETSAESWGTGRAVARIPRVPGGGTHRAGQGAFGNMCRGGSMFAPTKVWRRWGRVINVSHRRHAMASAIAASSIPAIVSSHGHDIDQVAEMPIVVSDAFESFKKTRDAHKLFIQLGLANEIQKVRDSKRKRAGRGKSRGRKYVQKLGPCVIFSKNDGIVKACRNMPGVHLMSVNTMSLLRMAPGGRMGRLVIWTEGAVKELARIFGDYTRGSSSLKRYSLFRDVVTNADLSRIINSDEVQTAIRPKMEQPNITDKRHNPLKHKQTMIALHPAWETIKAKNQALNKKGSAEYEAFAKKRKVMADETAAYKTAKRQHLEHHKQQLAEHFEKLGGFAQNMALAKATPTGDDEE